MNQASLELHHLTASAPLRAPLFRSIIQSLHLPPASHGLDAGCGIGLHTLPLAEAIGPAGHVTGLDVSPAFLRHARQLVNTSDLAKQISLQEGDIRTLPFEENTFDWVWCVDCVGYPTGELLPALRELARVVKPGGLVAVVAWSSQCLLPGYSLLEARLNATCSALIPHYRGQRPESHFMRARQWFRAAGLKEVAAETFVGDVQAPLNDELRVALASLFQMLWGEPQPEVTAEDRAKYQRLCEPESQECILNLADYYAFFTCSMFRGRVPE